MKEQLIELAKEKGFESKAIIFQYGANPAKLTIQEAEFSYYLWMCELQKWLRDSHKLIVQIESIWGDKEMKTIEYESWVMYRYFENHLPNEEPDIFKTYESALEFGLTQALDKL